MPQRKLLRESLGVDNESQFSHLLRDFEKARLIYRERPEGSREVYVGLDVEGREVAKQKMMQPDWVPSLAAYCETVGIQANASEIAGKLMRCGFPSKRGAVEIGKAIISGRENLVRIFSPSLEDQLPFHLLDDDVEFRSRDRIYKSANASDHTQSKLRSSVLSNKELSVY